MIEFTNYPLVLIFAASIVAILAACELGRWLGARARVGGGDDVSTLEAATLGLLALMISFTFAMSLSLYNARRDAVVNEANAIGTAALRARLLPAPHSKEILKLLREYTQIRVEITQHAPTIPEINAALVRSNAIHDELWQQVMTIAATNNAMVPTGVFVQSLNDLIDNQETRLTAARAHVPNIVLIALYCIAIVAITFTGYAAGLDARRTRPPVYVMGILVVAVILLIQDLDRPSGFISVSQQPMIDTAANIARYTD